MQWNSVSEFFAMGGYAFYVWGSFGITALVMAVEMGLIRARRRELLDELRNEQASQSLQRTTS
ncbi:MAG: heme exporter protein CcmD [Rhodoferax sp.]|jgi:heme exporter protein D|nr:heme exporter protein CcmD [Rhodoferax sp.]